MFIVIDFENTANFEIDLSQISDSKGGLAILDTKGLDLASLPLAKVISTYSFASGSAGYRKGLAQVPIRRVCCCNPH
jgi:hypothetical protein